MKLLDSLALYGKFMTSCTIRIGPFYDGDHFQFLTFYVNQVQC
jgi:hypothetical protein